MSSDLSVQKIGRFTKVLVLLGEMAKLFTKTLYSCVTRPFYFNKIVSQIISLGMGSVSISIVIGLVMGSVMTLNFGYGLTKFGGTLYVPAIVSLSLVREMGPIFTSLLVAGRVGSGIAAEIGSMNVTQQIDALRALGTSPIRMLVVPRYLALLISLPLLTTLADLLGILGSLMVSMSEFDIPPGFFFNKVVSTIKLHDYFSGLVKSMVFATIIVMVGCYRGLNTTDGTRGVGESTTWVVVYSSIWILVTNFICSKIFLTFWFN